MEQGGQDPEDGPVLAGAEMSPGDPPVPGRGGEMDRVPDHAVDRGSTSGDP